MAATSKSQTFPCTFFSLIRFTLLFHYVFPCSMPYTIHNCCHFSDVNEKFSKRIKFPAAFEKLLILHEKVVQTSCSHFSCSNLLFCSSFLFRFCNKVLFFLSTTFTVLLYENLYHCYFQQFNHLCKIHFTLRALTWEILQVVCKYIFIILSIHHHCGDSISSETNKHE